MKKILLLLLLFRLETAYTANVKILYVFFHNVEKTQVGRQQMINIAENSTIEEVGRLIKNFEQSNKFFFEYAPQISDICIASGEAFLKIKESDKNIFFTLDIGKNALKLGKIFVYPKSAFFERKEFQVPELDIKQATIEQIARASKQFLFPLVEKLHQRSLEIIINSDEVSQEVWDAIKKYYKTASKDYFLRTTDGDVLISQLRVFNNRRNTFNAIINGISLDASPKAQGGDNAIDWRLQGREDLLLLDKDLFEYSDLSASDIITINEKYGLIFDSIKNSQSILALMSTVIKLTKTAGDDGLKHYEINTTLGYIIDYLKKYMPKRSGKNKSIALLKSKYFDIYLQKVRVTRNGTFLKYFTLPFPVTMSFDQIITELNKYLISQDLDPNCEHFIQDIEGNTTHTNDCKTNINDVIKDPNNFLELRQVTKMKSAKK